MIQSDVQALVERLHLTNEIDKTTYKFLRQGFQNNKCGRLYFLPKVHKLSGSIINNLENIHNRITIKIPGRPIISQCGSPTELIGRLLDYFLQPVVKRQNTYTRDTTQILQVIENTVCPHDIILCTYDLGSMYTNMYYNELISAIENAYTDMRQSDYEIPLINKNYLINILKLVLYTNEFEFAGNHFVQRIGCSMGAVPSPSICDVRAYHL
ncbi:unnamed protein product [Mytilus edulis]|uniref:Reverse transcriptase domain-containing protein n=1 Tax=Mytilus edulis TaxID=6550 RepID=A0A8S3S9R6_MYTED|nr:unnamed protein product [Mytilus edulis]